MNVLKNTRKITESVAKLVCVRIGIGFYGRFEGDHTAVIYASELSGDAIEINLTLCRVVDRSESREIADIADEITYVDVAYAF